MRRGSFCQLSNDCRTLAEFAEKRRQVHGRAIKGKRIGIPVVVPDVGRGFLPGLNEDVLLAEQLQARCELLRHHVSAPKNLDQLRDHPELVFVRVGEHDRFEVRVAGIEGDLHVAP